MADSNVGVAVAETIVLTLYGDVPSKKNNYRPRKDHKGVFKDRALQAKLDYLLLQVPAEVRGLKLVHPEMTFDLTVSALRQDWDNIVQCIQDVLVQAGVLKSDNLKWCNGRKIINPVRVGQQPSATITLTVQG